AADPDLPRHGPRARRRSGRGSRAHLPAGRPGELSRQPGVAVRARAARSGHLLHRLPGRRPAGRRREARSAPARRPRDHLDRRRPPESQYYGSISYYGVQDVFVRISEVVVGRARDRSDRPGELHTFDWEIFAGDTTRDPLPAPEADPTRAPYTAPDPARPSSPDPDSGNA